MNFFLHCLLMMIFTQSSHVHSFWNSSRNSLCSECLKLCYFLFLLRIWLVYSFRTLWILQVINFVLVSTSREDSCKEQSSFLNIELEYRIRTDTWEDWGWWVSSYSVMIFEVPSVHDYVSWNSLLKDRIGFKAHRLANSAYNLKVFPYLTSQVWWC